MPVLIFCRRLQRNLAPAQKLRYFWPPIFALGRLVNIVHILYNIYKLNEPWIYCVQYHSQFFFPRLFRYRSWTAESFLNAHCLHKAEDFTLHESTRPGTQNTFRNTMTFHTHGFFWSSLIHTIYSFSLFNILPHSLLLRSEKKNQSYLISFTFTSLDKLQNRVILF